MSAEYSAPVLLREFLKAKGLTQAGAATQIGIVPAALTYYLKATQRPRADIRQRIAKWSEGAVPESSWLTAAEAGKLGDTDAAVAPEPKPEERAEEPAPEKSSPVASGDSKAAG
jgi:transcriptional regulator with XRE-family HTH domain